MQWVTATSLVLAIMGCTKPAVYAESEPIPEQSWEANKKFVFEPKINDATALYNVFFTLRNTGSYPYRNIWLFVERENPSGKKTIDTIDCPLAYPDGRWIGKSAGDLRDNLILYQQNIRFEESGKYRYTIQHGMRDEMLKEVTDVGLRIDRVKTND
jgi:gliding motility-associated lipoprotein GldH